MEPSDMLNVRIDNHLLCLDGPDGFSTRLDRDQASYVCQQLTFGKAPIVLVDKDNHQLEFTRPEAMSLVTLIASHLGDLRRANETTPTGPSYTDLSSDRVRAAQARWIGPVGRNILGL